MFSQYDLNFVIFFCMSIQLAIICNVEAYIIKRKKKKNSL